MIKVLNGSLDTLAILNNVINPIILEELNRGFAFSFQTVIDGDKSDYVTYQNIVEIEDNYFNIVYTKDNHNADDTLTIDVECEHVSYDLLGDENDPADLMIADSYVDVGTPTALLTTLFAGTSFTVGQVDFTALTTIAINEKVSKRGILLTLAAQLGGELKFNKYEISLLSRRGADNGLGFRYRRNLVSMSRITDNRNRAADLPTVTYDTDVVELEFAQGHGVDDHYELGDTVHLFDSQLGIIDLPVRIIKESHNPVQRMKGNVTISNTAGAFIKDISDTVVALQQTTITKESLYNGVKIGPDEGFVAIRSDNKVKSILNATEGISVQSGDGFGAWIDRFYVDVNGNIRLKDAFLELLVDAVRILISPTDGIKITKDNVDRFYVDTDGKIHLTDAFIDIVKDAVRILISPTDGIKITKDNVDRFYVDTDGNLTFDGRMAVTNSGNLLAEIFQDTNGGVLKIYDVTGKLNAKIGVESGTGVNTGGTLILYVDVPTGSDPDDYKRVETGTARVLDCGLVNYRDTNKKARVSIQADSAVGPYSGIRDSSEVLKTYMTETEMFMNTKLVATQEYVAETYQPIISGATGTFTTVDGKTVTVTDGVVSLIL